ncbi:hypothetical protein OAO01_02770 [Oligoflexia bacterium]|nr:hypothetical protein [Oligoflexia bacterium]
MTDQAFDPEEAGPRGPEEKERTFDELKANLRATDSRFSLEWEPKRNGFVQNLVSLRAAFSPEAVQTMMQELGKLVAEFHAQKEDSDLLPVFAPSVSSFILGSLFHKVESEIDGLVGGWRDFQVRGGECVEFTLLVFPKLHLSDVGKIAQPTSPSALGALNLDLRSYRATPKPAQGGMIDFGLKRVA